MAFRPPVSAIRGGSAPSRVRQARSMTRGLGSAGEGDAGDAGVGDSAAPTSRRRPGSRCSTPAVRPPRAAARRRRRRPAGFARRAWRRRIAGGERGGNLAREDGEREVPGRDAGENARPWNESSFPRRSDLEESVGPRISACAAHIAQKVDRLAQIGLGHCRASCRLPAPAAPSSAARSASNSSAPRSSNAARVSPPSRSQSSLAARAAPRALSMDSGPRFGTPRRRCAGHAARQS